METLYKKIKTSERLPDKPDQYHTNMGLIYYKNPKHKSSTYTSWTWEYDGSGFYIDPKEVKYWLEKLPPQEQVTVEKIEDAVVYLEQNSEATARLTAKAIHKLYGEKGESEIMWGFLFNDNTWESCARTVSIHRTLKGAQMALEFHKQNWMKEEELTKTPKSTYWGIEGIEIQN